MFLKVFRKILLFLTKRKIGTPTFILFYKGEIVTTMTGAMSMKSLVDRIFEGLVSVIQPPLTEEQTDTE